MCFQPFQLLRPGFSVAFSRLRLHQYRAALTLAGWALLALLWLRFQWLCSAFRRS